jgi:hypothetical protein
MPAAPIRRVRLAASDEFVDLPARECAWLDADRACLRAFADEEELPTVVPPAVLLHGHALAAAEGSDATLVSCGGLLARVRARLAEDQPVRILLRHRAGDA